MVVKQRRLIEYNLKTARFLELKHLLDSFVMWRQVDDFTIVRLVGPTKGDHIRKILERNAKSTTDYTAIADRV